MCQKLKELYEKKLQEDPYFADFMIGVPVRRPEPLPPEEYKQLRERFMKENNL